MRFALVAAAIVFAATVTSAPLARAGTQRGAIVSETISVQSQSAKLVGTLLLPAGRGPFPVALIIGGSGPVDRDGNNNAGLHSDAYKLLAEGLAQRGVATLRYDKRGVGASTNKKSEDAIRFDDYVDDALAFAKHLEADKRFSRVAIIGHSEGSLIGLVASRRDPRVSAFVSLEGPGRTVAAVIEEQIRAQGAPESIMDEIEAYDKSLIAGTIVPSPDPRLAALYRPSVQPYLISEYRHDPSAEIAKLKIPVLIVQGTTDLQVSVLDAQLLARAKPDARLSIIDGMNHLLRDAPPDRQANIATYNAWTTPLDAAVIPAVAKFLLDQSHRVQSGS